MINCTLNSQFGRRASRCQYSTEFTDFRQIFEIIFLNKNVTMFFCHSVGLFLVFMEI